VLVTGLEMRFPQPANDPVPLARGYATFGSDSGHTGNNASFGLNDEALLNFAYEQLKKTKDTAFEIIRLYYGKPPKYSYFAGHSEGAREGHAVSQRYPKDYDGIIAVVPILNEEGTHIHDNAVLTALAQGGWMNQNKIKLITDSTLALCDGLDGLKDGIISKYGVFDPSVGWKAACPHDASTLRCPTGKDEGDSCLSDAQVNAVNVIRNRFLLPFPVQSGSTGYIGYGAMGGESNGTAWDTIIIGKKAPPVPQPPGVWDQAAYGVGGIPYYGHTNMRFFIARDPGFQTYDFKPEAFRERIQYLSSLIDTLDPDISAFVGHGGKMIMKENTGDYHRSTFLGINYYKSLLDKLGEDTVKKSVRLYVAVGPNHFGQFAPSQADLITLLENWVEKGTAPPEHITAVDMDPKDFTVKSSKPMCGYGFYPRYNGSGDPKDAASFTCSPL
jgi:feruloyl esterase